MKEAQILLYLALPLILMQLAQVAILTTDVIMMSLLDEFSLAAGGLAFFLFNVLRTMGFGMVIGVANLIAKVNGANGNETDINGVNSSQSPSEILYAGLVVASVAALIAIAVMLSAVFWLPVLGQDPRIVSQTATYLTWMAPGMLPAFWFYVYRGLSTGMRITAPLLWITIISVVLNAGLNWIFINGFWGVPKMGLSGIAVASSLVFLISFIGMATVIHKRVALGRFIFQVDQFGQTIRNLLKIGFPTAASYGSEAGFFAVVALLMGTLGPEALAAHTLVNQVIYIVFMIAIGLSHAASIGISEAQGIGDDQRTIRVGKTAFLIGIAIMMTLAVIYFINPTAIITAITFKSGHQPQTVILLATQLLFVAGILQVFDCTQNIGIGVLRGLDKAKVGFLITLAGYWVFGLPSAYLFGFYLQFGAIGIWIGLAIGVAFTACAFVVAFIIYSVPNSRYVAR